MSERIDKRRLERLEDIASCCRMMGMSTDYKGLERALRAGGWDERDIGPVAQNYSRAIHLAQQLGAETDG